MSIYPIFATNKLNSMIDKAPSCEEIEEILRQIFQNMKVFGIVYLNRDKNTQALFDLGITGNQRTELIYSLKCRNYSEGPLKDNYDTIQPDYYVFGLDVNGKEVYIKISIGLKNKAVLCYSFHIAEHKIDYPLKK